jgi:hypothetical protein
MVSPGSQARDAGRFPNRSVAAPPEPRPRAYAGDDPPPWGPLSPSAQQIAAGQVVPAGVIEPEVLPMIARAVRSPIMFRGGMSRDGDAPPSASGRR